MLELRTAPGPPFLLRTMAGRGVDVNVTHSRRNVAGARIATAVVAALAAAAGAGCGGDSGGGGVVSCSASESAPDAGIAVMICQEAAGLTPQQLASLRQQCTGTVNLPDAGITGGEQLVNGPCPRTHALGGCKITAGATTITNWYYDDGSGTGLQPADVQMLCAGIGATFVPA
jgi:hypothetical protein